MNHLPTPGHLPLCAGCARRLPDLSHPSPCLAIRWREGYAGRHLPDLTADADAVVCGDFAPAEPVPEPWQPKAPTPPAAGPSGGD